jgi:metal transporter CNNM
MKGFPRAGYGTLRDGDVVTSGDVDNAVGENGVNVNGTHVSDTRVRDEDEPDPLKAPSPTNDKASATPSYHSRLYDPRTPGPTRSGSITEQVIDINGIRKVVLQTTSSSSSDAERLDKSQLDGVRDRDNGSVRGGHHHPFDSRGLNRVSKQSRSRGGKRRRKKRSGGSTTTDEDDAQPPLLG